MGFLTTFTIYNDALDQIKQNPEELAEAVYNGAIGVLTRDFAKDSGYAGIGNHGNAITVQRPRHADDKAVYVHAGNTVVNVSSVFGSSGLARQNPKFYGELVDQVQETLKRMKQYQKEVKYQEEVDKALSDKWVGQNYTNQILFKSLRSGFIKLKDLKDPNIISCAIEEGDRCTELEEIGSSDWTHIIKGFLGDAGIETEFVNSRLQLKKKKK